MTVLMNWWCPECKTWLASEDMNEARRHKTCNTKAQWKEYRVCEESCVLKRPKEQRQ